MKKVTDCSVKFSERSLACALNDSHVSF